MHFVKLYQTTEENVDLKSGGVIDSHSLDLVVVNTTYKHTNHSAPPDLRSRIPQQLCTCAHLVKMSIIHYLLLCEPVYYSLVLEKVHRSVGH